MSTKRNDAKTGNEGSEVAHARYALILVIETTIMSMFKPIERYLQMEVNIIFTTVRVHIILSY